MDSDTVTPGWSNRLGRAVPRGCAIDPASGGSGRVDDIARDGISGSKPTDCQRCGVCCFSDLPTFVRVSGVDWDRLGEAAERYAHFIGNRAYMKVAGGHCAALVVTSDALGAHFHCQVYERRPEVCRALERGSPACEAERELKSARVDWIASPGVVTGP